MARVTQMSPVQRRRAASRRRDGALERLSTITAGIGVGVVAAVAALGIYVGRTLPGHHAGSPNRGAVTSGNTGQGQAGQPSVSQGSINPPSSPPQSAPTPAPVTSGGS